MNHQSLKRPELPGITKVISSPSSSSPFNSKSPDSREQLINPYKSSLQPMYHNKLFSNTNHINTDDDIDILKDTQLVDNYHVMDRYVKKVLKDLPINTRETLTSLFHQTQMTIEKLSNDLVMSKSESNKLRNQLKKNFIESEKTSRIIANYQDQTRISNINVRTMQEEVAQYRKKHIRNMRALNRMTSTNHMLIDALNVINMSNKYAEKHSKGLRNESTNEIMESSSPSSLSDKGNFVSEKLEETVMRLARSYYSSMKTIEMLELRVEKLRISTKKYNQKVQQLQLELDDMLGKQGERYDADTDEEEMRNLDTSAKSTTNTIFSVNPRRPYETIDHRFETLVNARTVDASEGLIQLRKAVEYLGNIKSKNDLNSLLQYFVSPELAKILSVDYIIIYLKPCVYNIKGSEAFNSNIISKYTTRSSNPEIIDISDLKHSTSIAGRVLSGNGKAIRLNTIDKVKSFNSDIDSSPGILVNRLMSIPLFKNLDNEFCHSIFGAIHLINKHSFFSESDEIVIGNYSKCISTNLLSSEQFQIVCTKIKLLESLLEASTSIYDVVPDSILNSSNTNKSNLDRSDVLNLNSLSLANPNSQPWKLEESIIIQTIESIFMNVLKLKRVRTFLINNSNTKEIIFIDPDLSHSSSSSSSKLILRKASSDSGLVAHAISSKQSFELCNQYDSYNDHMNSLVDLEYNHEDYLLVIPIISISGDVIAVVELVRGIYSPKLRCLEDTMHDYIDFIQASMWLAKQLTHPIEYLTDSLRDGPIMIHRNTSTLLSGPMRVGTPIAVATPTTTSRRSTENLASKLSIPLPIKRSNSASSQYQKNISARSTAMSNSKSIDDRDKLTETPFLEDFEHDSFVNENSDADDESYLQLKKALEIAQERIVLLTLQLQDEKEKYININK